MPTTSTRSSLRAEISDSWHRSAASGVAVDGAEAPITLPDSALRSAREAHPLAQVLPLLEDVLAPAVRECSAVLAIGDADGQLLWVSGPSSAMRRAEHIGFVPGSNWDERMVGTNAPGMALTLDTSVEVDGVEHFREAVRSWSCVATPIHDPRTHEVLGVLDVTGGNQLIVPQTTAMVRAAARLAEAELVAGLGSPGERLDLPGGQVQVEALGRAEALVRLAVEPKAPVVRLGARHSEIVVLLAAHPRGLTGEELSALVWAGDVSPATVRAELNRLRAALGEDIVGSRPYRLLKDVSGDWLLVEALLARGELDHAVRSYRGRLLPRSRSPGVAALADSTEWSVRTAILESGRTDLMARWTRTVGGGDDLEMWQAQAAALPPHSPLQAMVRGQVARLDRELGLPEG